MTTTQMQRHNFIKFFAFWILSVSLTCCAGNTATTQSENPEHSIEIGTNIGNPPEPKNILSFEIVNEMQPYLKECHLVENKTVLSQRCPVFVNGVSLRILRIDALDCLGESGEHLACNNPETVSIGSRTTIYSGDPIVVDIYQDKIDFPEALDSIPPGEIGGLQFVTSYVQVELPDTDNPEASRISEEMAGDKIRVCTSKMSANGYPEDCGEETAELWNILTDKDDDGVFEFMFSYAHNPLSSYFENMNRQLSSNAPNDVMARSNMSDGVFYAEGYFSPIVSLDEPATIDDSFNLTIQMDTTHSFSFMDGGIDHISKKKVCVGALFPQECKALGYDSDPKSVGVYSPMFDGHPYLFFPKVKLVDDE